ncbi:Aminoacyl-tRNA synthetase class Ic [Carpediemonas membranifera]|uniref:tyrosine--tRNA ligase n=1 Tax=Carpediemonas membranifera TaxID=201153 RepID=A0A8J6BDZ9_9EUKA|nr:Aminoacyl-tRNA synthetase class Ic [Carpediemonas membranifera]|eukprot:KAG9395502.1 Aminoacyl-tRNA synthetase class Ic [Carpediemonas membranifera]
MSEPKQNNAAATKPKQDAQKVTEAPELKQEVLDRVALCASVGEEIIPAVEAQKPTQKDSFYALLDGVSEGRVPIVYDGFEPSGRMHIAQGLMKAINVNKMTDAGCKFVFWIADWFALMNDKFGGDLEKIRKCGQYFIEVWKACGMDLSEDKVEFRWASEDIAEQAPEYWSRVLDILRQNTLNRLVRCSQIMGRGESDQLSVAQILYPSMQCSDVFFLKSDICQLGKDQRKVNMLARDYCTTIGRREKPIIVSHHMLLGLKEGQAKMSKSDPMSAIFMDDNAADVTMKIMAGYCPTDDLALNPVFDYIKFIIIPRLGSIAIDGKDFTDAAEVGAAFQAGAISEQAMKQATADALNVILEPIRTHFREDDFARNLAAEVQGFKRDGTAPIPTPPTGPAKTPFLDTVTPSGPATLVSLLKKAVYGKTTEGELVTVVCNDWVQFLEGPIPKKNKKKKPVAPQAEIAQLGLRTEYYRLALDSIDSKSTVVPESVFLSDPEYWHLVIEIARKMTLHDVVAKFMPQHLEFFKPVEDDKPDPMNPYTMRAAHIVAWVLRIADVLYRDTDVCIFGGDKAMVAKEAARLAPLVGRRAPRLMTHPLLGAFASSAGEVPRMKKTPQQAIYLDEVERSLKKRVNQLFCPLGVPEEYAVMGIIEHIIIPLAGSLTVAIRDVGDVTYDTMEAIFNDCRANEGEEPKLHPADLKAAVFRAVNDLAGPVTEKEVKAACKKAF